MNFFQRVSDFLGPGLSLKNIILTNLHWPLLFLIIFISYSIQKIVKGQAIKAINKLANKHDINTESLREKHLILPLSLMAFAGVWVIGVQLIGLPTRFLDLFLRLGRILFSVASVIAVYGIVDNISLYFENMARKSQNKFDDILIPLVRKTVKFFVIAIGIIFIGDSLALDMKSLIAGLGIGGLAFALAAKDTISNLFGSVTVILDRPFRIGDWVNINNNIEGTVEEVGLRSTKIRTFYDSVISVPNGSLTNVHIDNLGQRKYRRYNTKIGVQYDTPPKLVETFCEGIRQIILKHKWTRKDYFHVYLNDFSSSSIDIMVYVFWEVPDWSTELSEKHRLLLDILRLGNEIGINFAFPTQTVHLFKEEHTKYKNLQDPDSHLFGKIEAEKVTANPLSMKNHRSGSLNGSTFEKDELSL